MSFLSIFVSLVSSSTPPCLSLDIIPALFVDLGSLLSHYTGHTFPPLLHPFGYQEPPYWSVSVDCVLEKRSGGFPLVCEVSPKAIVCGEGIIYYYFLRYFWMWAFVLAQGRAVCVCVCVFSLRTDDGPCVFFPASDCPWHIHKRISTHLTACISVYRIDMCLCVHAYVCVHLCSCVPRINNAIQPYYESTEQTDTDWMQRTRSQTKHAQNSVSESTYACRITRVNQSFWAKMATPDLNYSMRSVLWEGGAGHQLHSQHLSSYLSNGKWNSLLASTGCSIESPGKPYWEA